MSLKQAGRRSEIDDVIFGEVHATTTSNFAPMYSRFFLLCARLYGNRITQSMASTNQHPKIRRDRLMILSSNAVYKMKQRRTDK